MLACVVCQGGCFVLSTLTRLNGCTDWIGLFCGDVVLERRSRSRRQALTLTVRQKVLGSRGQILRLPCDVDGGSSSVRKREVIVRESICLKWDSDRIEYGTRLLATTS